MDFRKFYDLLATEELYFRRTDVFKETDPQEALASDQYLRAALGLSRYDIHDEIHLIDTQGFDGRTAKLITSTAGRYLKAKRSTFGADTAGALSSSPDSIS